MLKSILALMIVCFLTSCTSPPKTPQRDGVPVDAAVPQLDVQSAVTNCLTPHEVFTFPPQPLPGIPVILTRHAECLGATNIVILIWPQAPNRVKLLYVKMLVESYLMHLEKSNEIYSAELVGINTVIIGDEDTAQLSDQVTSAAVFKLTHLQKKEEK